MEVSDFKIPDVILVFVLGISLAFLSKSEPKRLYIPEDYPLCKFPYKNAGISGFVNLMVVTVIPIVFYLIMYIVLKVNDEVEYVVPYNVIGVTCLHLGSIFISGLMCHFVKNYVGRPRPDYYDYVKNIAANHPQKEVMAKEAFKSFPSGHSCTAASGCLSFCLILSKMLYCHDLWCIFLKIIPISYAFFIGTCRVREYRHHPDDVIAGMLFGFIITMFCHLASSYSLFDDVKP